MTSREYDGDKDKNDLIVYLEPARILRREYSNFRGKVDNITGYSTIMAAGTSRYPKQKYRQNSFLHVQPSKRDLSYEAPNKGEHPSQLHQSTATYI